MDEELHTVQRPKRNRGNPRQRRKCGRRDQSRISVRIGTLNLCTADHVTPKSTDGGDETTGTHEIKPERLLLENDPHMEDIDESDEEDYVEIFMTENGLRTRPPCRAESVKRLCHSKPLQELVSNNSDISSEKRCLVDEMANDGSSSTRIGTYEPLTNREFYYRRKKNRFHPTTSRELNADRSLSFAENPDRHTIGAIMLTAPTLQVIPLRDFFYYYTSFRPHIRFSKKPRGFFNFAHAQQFHLPFYAWRRARQEPKDTRTKTDGSPFRRVFNMQFLRGKPSGPVGEVDYLCQGQISVLITAFHERVTGYCFVDTYCQSQNERQTAKSYCQSDSDEGDLNVQPDPFTSGICDSNQPIRDPNHYFLTVLDCQLQVFRDEWTNTVHQISSMVQDYTDNFPYPFRKTHNSSAKDTERPSVWLRATRRELTRLIRCLKKTLQCWGNCASEEQLSALYEQLGLHSIPETISDLKICLRDLKETLELCDEHERNVGTYVNMMAEWMLTLPLQLNLDNIDAQQDNNEAQQHASQLQTTAAQNSQKATDFLLYVISPITAAAAILSMQEKAIPTFLGPNKLSFFVLVPILIIFVVAVFKVIHSWDRIFPALGQRMKWHQVERHRTEDIELADIEP